VVDSKRLRLSYLKNPAMGGDRAHFQQILREVLDAYDAQVVEIASYEAAIIASHVYDCCSCKFCAAPVDSSAESNGSWLTDTHGAECPITKIQVKRSVK
jgi:hypothetical protein